MNEVRTDLAQSIEQLLRRGLRQLLHVLQLQIVDTPNTKFDPNMQVRTGSESPIPGGKARRTVNSGRSKRSAARRYDAMNDFATSGSTRQTRRAQTNCRAGTGKGSTKARNQIVTCCRCSTELITDMNDCHSASSGAAKQRSTQVTNQSALARTSPHRQRASDAGESGR